MRQIEHSMGEIDDQFRAESKRAEKLFSEKQDTEDK